MEGYRGAVAAGILLLVVTGEAPALAALAAPVAAFGRRLWSCVAYYQYFQVSGKS